MDAYAHAADRRDAKGHVARFTANTHFVVYMNAKDPTPSMELDATTHFVGQSTLFTLTEDRRWGNLLPRSSRHDRRLRAAPDARFSALLGQPRAAGLDERIQDSQHAVTFQVPLSL